MAEILVEVTSWLSLLPRISVGSILETVIISFLVYKLPVWVKNIKIWSLLKGPLVISVFVLFVAVLRPATILWILENTTTTVVTTLLVILQPEFRKALEQLGSRSYMSYLFSLDEGKDNQGSNDETINRLIRTTSEMTKVKIDALVVTKRGSSLKKTKRTGVEINGLVTSQLLINILEHSTSLYDGAVAIRGNRITTATCYLLLTDNMSVSKSLDTHHRTAVGVSGSMGSITTVVPKETGRVSVAKGGVLSRIPGAESLKKVFSNVKKGIVSLNRPETWKGRLKNGEKAIQ